MNPDIRIPIGHVHVRHEDIELRVGPRVLLGLLSIPDQARSVIVFAHGSGSSRLSPRNRAVAENLNTRGMATLLFDLLTADEERDRSNVFDIPLLGDRLARVTDWMKAGSGLTAPAVGYFGASTGAGAALWAAGQRGDIGAVVSRGGRPDLAGERLKTVQAPTLLIVGGRDPVVEKLNRDAQAELRSESRLVIVPGATHLFEERGALAEVARLAADWFEKHLTNDPSSEETSNE